MEIFVTVVHVLVCVFMIFVILLQPGKDAGMGAALGGGAATSAFGGRGAVTFLSKLTAVCAAMFFVTSLGLSFVGLRRSVAASVTATKPAVPPPAFPFNVKDGGSEAPPPPTGANDNPAANPAAATGEPPAAEGAPKATPPAPEPAPAQ